MSDEDPHDLQRFLGAQDRGGAYDQALEELRRGRKQSHWMWFVFPQIRGLGRSPMAERFGIASLDEARAYLAHPVLGPRLVECARVLLAAEEQSAEAILGSIDAVKLRSCMTLFAQADSGWRPFTDVLDRFFAGAADQATLGRI